MTNGILTPAVEQVRAVIERRGLSEAEVARMAEVGPKTIRRLLTGRTCGRETLERVCTALGISLDPTAVIEARVLARVRQHMGQDRAGRSSVGQDGARPVCGWDQAAQVLGVSRWTLRRYRREAGDLTAVPWWRDRAALLVWFERLADGLSDPGTSDDPGTGDEHADAGPAPVSPAQVG